VIVVDAGALTAALVDGDRLGESARRELQADSHWVAPALLLIEVTSAVRGLARSGQVGVRRAEGIIRALPDLELDVVDSADLVRRIWALRHNLSAYDAAYVAAAEQRGCPLVTTDARLARASGPRCEIRLVDGSATER
jgi:predicted nucleic acid-binding protein